MQFWVAFSEELYDPSHGTPTVLSSQKMKTLSGGICTQVDLFCKIMLCTVILQRETGMVTMIIAGCAVRAAPDGEGGAGLERAVKSRSRQALL